MVYWYHSHNGSSFGRTGLRWTLVLVNGKRFKNKIFIKLIWPSLVVNCQLNCNPFRKGTTGRSGSLGLLTTWLIFEILVKDIFKVAKKGWLNCVLLCNFFNHQKPTRKKIGGALICFLLPRSYIFGFFYRHVWCHVVFYRRRPRAGWSRGVHIFFYYQYRLAGWSRGDRPLISWAVTVGWALLLIRTYVFWVGPP